jgi:hypothetical protein
LLLKSLTTILKILSSNHLQELVQVFKKPPGVQKPRVISKIVPKASHDLYTGENRPMAAKESGTEILMLLFEKSFE